MSIEIGPCPSDSFSLFMFKNFFGMLGLETYCVILFYKLLNKEPVSCYWSFTFAKLRLLKLHKVQEFSESINLPFTILLIETLPSGFFIFVL